MRQSWHDLLFAHWPVDARALRARLPPGLELDCFDGRAWLAIVPFRMTNVAPRSLPVPHAVSAFTELNVRTYVTRDGRPGVFFFSLDANSRLAVAVARTFFRLPYYAAAMSLDDDGVTIRCSSRRASGGGCARLEIAYGPGGPPFEPRPGTLEHFLTERYCLYTADAAGRAYRLEIHHPPWMLQPAEADVSSNTMADAAGIRLDGTAPLLHFARRQDVLAWPLRRLR